MTVPCQCIYLFVLNSVLHWVRYEHSIALVAEKRATIYCMPFLKNYLHSYPTEGLTSISCCNTLSLYPFRSPTEILLIESDILKIDEVFKYSMGIFMFKFHHNKFPALFTKMFKNITDVHKHRTRSTSNLSMPTCSTTRMQKSLRYCGPKIWNRISKHSDIKCTIGTFNNKKRMKKISRSPDFELQ